MHAQWRIYELHTFVVCDLCFFGRVFIIYALDQVMSRLYLQLSACALHHSHAHMLHASLLLAFSC